MQSQQRIILSVEHLQKSFGPKEVLRDVTFTAAAGEFVCIVGPSGAGKTTLLRALAQLGPADGGRVLLDGREVTEPPSEMAVVFQDYSRSLMPWMRVAANVELPLLRSRLSKAERSERIQQALVDVGLPDAGRLYPWQMSGGMQQRVAIARSLAYRPEVLIMDEPFASVDAQTRADLEDLMLDLRDRLGVTIVLVTHDIDESVYLSDKVIVLSGSPATVTATVPVPLGAPRDQIATKATPEFLALRAEIHGLIAHAGARPVTVSS
ncbi:ABC transporter ATP-binding protein [Microbacterium luteum]|uniref:ABC transporter ATP-binding protein n=1 Tax=Microbacterium TaxID=33882 RepID=UPI001889142E|nr:ABC transporter ATP-binding protein [Microbacterium luteum]|tara:strand:+ start:133 stop:927 length:795 start_codon:yes stop_codon:yes gene_type:complete